MKRQSPWDLAGLVLAIVLAIGSFTPWITISFLSVNGIDTWWGFVTLTGALALGFRAVTRLWPGAIDQSIARHSRNVALAGLLASLAILGYVGVRLTEASRQFSSEMDSGTTEVTEDTSGLGEEFDDALNEFTEALSDLFNPRLATGWYLSVAGTIGGLVVTVRREPEGDELPPPHITA